MNLPPRNPNAAELNYIPNTPSTQAVTAAQQQGARNDSNLLAQVPQTSAEATNQMRTSQAAQSTAQAAADAQLNYTKAVLLDRAGLTQGAQTMANLANTYAPQGGDVATIAQAIRQGLRL